MKLILYALLSFCTLHESSSDCCGFTTCLCDGGMTTRNYCDDCTLPTPACCGYGPCNMFCCNCDKGCRRGDPCYSCPANKSLKCTTKKTTKAPTILTTAAATTHNNATIIETTKAAVIISPH